MQGSGPAKAFSLQRIWASKRAQIGRYPISMATPGSAPPGLDLSSQLIQTLRTTEVRIPPYPAVAMSLDRLSRDPKSTITDVTSVIAADASSVVRSSCRVNFSISA
ncbi:MAG: hypothetical protein ACREBE_14235 [bacterium]